MCKRQSRKVIWDMIIIHVHCSWHCSCRTYFCRFPLALANIYRCPFVPFFFQFLWRTVNSKSATIHFGIVACTFSYNLSRNSCILEVKPGEKGWFSQRVCQYLSKTAILETEASGRYREVVLVALIVNIVLTHGWVQTRILPFFLIWVHLFSILFVSFVVSLSRLVMQCVASVYEQLRINILEAL